MTQKSPTINFDLEESLALIMAIEFVLDNPTAKLKHEGRTHRITQKYINYVLPIRAKLAKFQSENKDAIDA